MAKSNHVLTSEHELMTKAEVRDMLKEQKCKLTQLPYLWINDPAVEHLMSTGAKVVPGSVIRITRPTMSTLLQRSTETEIYYRLIIEPYEGLP